MYDWEHLEDGAVVAVAVAVAVVVIAIAVDDDGGDKSGDFRRMAALPLLPSSGGGGLSLRLQWPPVSADCCDWCPDCCYRPLHSMTAQWR